MKFYIAKRKEAAGASLQYHVYVNGQKELSIDQIKAFDFNLSSGKNMIQVISFLPKDYEAPSIIFFLTKHFPTKSGKLEIHVKKIHRDQARYLILENRNNSLLDAVKRLGNWGLSLFGGQQKPHKLILSEVT